MPGLLSSLFDGEDQPSGHMSVVPEISLIDDGSDNSGSGPEGTTPQTDPLLGESGGTGDTASAGEGSSSTYLNATDGTVHATLNPTIGLHTEMGGSYTDLSGTTHSWTDSEDITLNADVNALVGVATDYTIDSAEG